MRSFPSNHSLNGPAIFSVCPRIRLLDCFKGGRLSGMGGGGGLRVREGGKKRKEERKGNAREEVMSSGPCEAQVMKGTVFSV